MRQRIKQAALTFGLALPLLTTIAVSDPWSATAAAQGGLRMVGPAFPILIDSGDGMPGAGDTPVLPQQTGATTVQLPTLFSCQTQPNNTVTLSSPDSAGRFRAASRVNNGRDQVVNVTNAVNGAAVQFSFSESLRTQTFATGTGTLVDTNGDRLVEAMSITGTNGSLMVSLVFTPDSGYVSIPQAQAAALGVRQGRCGPVPGQAWVPLADRSGDGRGDTIILDLDGNGVPDPQYFESPPLGAVGVPTLNTLGLALLTMLLGGVGVWYLGRDRIDVTARA